MRPPNSAVTVRKPPQTIREQMLVAVSWKIFVHINRPLAGQGLRAAVCWPPELHHSLSCWDGNWSLRHHNVVKTARKHYPPFCNSVFPLSPQVTSWEDTRYGLPISVTFTHTPTLLINAAHARGRDYTKFCGRSSVSVCESLLRKVTIFNQQHPKQGESKRRNTRQSCALGPGAATWWMCSVPHRINTWGGFYLEWLGLDLALDNRPSHPSLDKTNVQTILIVQRNIFYNEIKEKLQYHLQKVGKRWKGRWIITHPTPPL